MSDNQQVSEGQLDIIFYYGAHPLWQYLNELFKIDILEVCPRVSKDQPLLDTKYGKLKVDIVDLPFDKQLDHMSNNDVIFLLNSINTVFTSLSAGIEKDGVKILQSVKFGLDSNHNMRLIDIATELPISDRALAVVKC